MVLKDSWKEETSTPVSTLVVKKFADDPQAFGGVSSDATEMEVFVQNDQHCVWRDKG